MRRLEDKQEGRAIKVGILQVHREVISLMRGLDKVFFMLPFPGCSFGHPGEEVLDVAWLYQVIKATLLHSVYG